MNEMFGFVICCSSTWKMQLSGWSIPKVSSELDSFNSKNSELNTDYPPCDVNAEPSK